MLQVIADYREGKIRYSQMVGNLAGAFDTGEFKDGDLREKWYDRWTPLEIVRATLGDEIPTTEVVAELSKMREFLLGTLAGEE